MRASGIDGPEIGERAKQIADERLRAIVECRCRKPDGGGDVDASACPVHQEPLPVDLLCGLRADQVCNTRTAAIWREYWRAEYEAAVAAVRKSADPRDCWGRVVPWRVLP